MSLAQVRSLSEKGTLVIRVLWPDLWLRGIRLCSLLIHTSIYIIIARALGPHLFGSYLFVQWLATITLPLIGTGMSTLVSRRVAEVQSREQPRLIAGVFYFLWYRQHRSILLYCLTYILLSFLLVHLFHIVTVGILLLTGLSTLPLLLSNVAGTTLRSIRRADLLTMLHLFCALLSLLLVIIATQIDGEPIEAFILALALSSTLTLILAVICVVRLLPLEQALPPGIFLRERLTGSLHHSWLAFLFDAVVWQRSELLLLACWHSSAEVGFYAVASIVSARLVKLAPTLFLQWIFPIIQRYAPGQWRLNPSATFMRMSCSMILLAVPISSLLIICSPALVMQSLGSAYLPIVQPLRLLVIASAFGSVATVSLTYLEGYKRFLSREQQRVQMRLNAGMAALKICLTIPLVALWGMDGAAVASLLTQVAWVLTSIFLCRRLLVRVASSPAGRL